MQTCVQTTYSLVIGCHRGLESLYVFDVDNGKKLIRKLFSGVALGEIETSKEMPSNFRGILRNSESSMHLVFVGHSNFEGNLILQNLGDEKQESVSPELFFEKLYFCKGKLTLFLYTCNSHLWSVALRKIENSTLGRSFLMDLSIVLRVCTQSENDESNQKAFYRSVQNFNSTPVGQESQGIPGRGHGHLHGDAEQDEAALSSPQNLPLSYDD